MSDFSQSDLASLWIQAGGPSAVASLMAAIAMAESSGNPNAVNTSSGACGLWQIHPAQSGCSDPFKNAQMAVAKYNSQGLNAWSAYTNGAYKQFLGVGTAPSSDSSQNQNSSSQNCRTFNALGVCWDGVVGLSAVALGLGLIGAAVFVMVIRSQSGQQAIGQIKKSAEQVAVVAAA